MKYVQQLLDKLDELQYGSLASIMGRYYAMDRDKRHDRIKIAYEGLVQGKGEKCSKSNIIQVWVITDLLIGLNFPSSKFSFLLNLFSHRINNAEPSIPGENYRKVDQIFSSNSRLP